MLDKELARITVRDKNCEGDSLLVDADEMTRFLLSWGNISEDNVFNYKKSKGTAIFTWKDADSMRLFSYSWHDKIKNRDSLRIVAALDALNCYKNSWVEVQYL